MSESRSRDVCKAGVGQGELTTFDAAKVKAARELWEELGDVPMDPETECIEAEWHGFPAGTHREDIWHWFDEICPLGVAELMYGGNENGKEE